MRAVQISFFIDPQRRSPATLLREWRSLVELAVAADSAGAQVTVIQASMVSGRLTRSGVTFHFVAPDAEGIPLTRSAAFRALVLDLVPDVFHVHGLGFASEVLELHDLAPQAPILVQDHADRVPRFWRRGSWRRGARVTAGVSFCARAQAEPFRRARLLGPDTHVFEIPESTSSFVPADAAEAREATGLHGDPAVLWVGHLNSNKDPLTVLDGIGIAAHDLPKLQLWCCYGSAPLLSTVQDRIARDSMLRGRVHLLGRVPHERIEQLMCAADLFVLGSHREGGSFALIEALATGLTPVVTDIPSSRALTGNGRIGRLWPCGDSRALGSALFEAAAAREPSTRHVIRAHFDEQLSSAAIGRKLVAAYRRLLTPQASAAGARLAS